MPIAVSDFGASKNEIIEHAAEVLGKSTHRKAVFIEVYRGKKRAKTITELMARIPQLNRNRILDAGKALADNKLVESIKIDGVTAYQKLDYIGSQRKKILRLASNAKARAALPTKRKVLGQTVRVKLDIRVPKKSMTANYITLDEIDSFSQVRAISRPGQFYKMPETTFKNGVARILGETGEFKDWGGESSDLFSTNLVVAGTRRLAAFAFKGPGMSGKLTPGKLGKNGDQIQRLLKCPAEVFIIQYWGQVEQSVFDQLEALARLRAYYEGRRLLYGVIDGYDSARLIFAYPQAFAI